MGGLSTIDATSTVDEFETAVDDVREAATTMGEPPRSMEAQVAALETAVADLQGHRDSLEGDVTVEEAVQGAGAAITAVMSARDEVGTSPTVRWSRVSRPPRRTRKGRRRARMRPARAPRLPKVSGHTQVELGDDDDARHAVPASLA